MVEKAEAKIEPEELGDELSKPLEEIIKEKKGKYKYLSNFH
jgi:hypothetical protein